MTGGSLWGSGETTATRTRVRTTEGNGEVDDDEVADTDDVRVAVDALGYAGVEMKRADDRVEQSLVCQTHTQYIRPSAFTGLDAQRLGYACGGRDVRAASFNVFR